MVKIFGSMLIIFSLGMIGFIKAEKLKKRYEEMLDFKKILVMLQGEIRYNNSAIAEAFLHVSNHFKGAYASILDEASGRTSDNSGESFEKIWLEIVDKNKDMLNVNDSDMDIIRELGKSIGYLDREMQNKSLDMLIGRAQITIDEQCEKLPENMKIYRCMGIMMGIFVILLIL